MTEFCFLKVEFGEKGLFPSSCHDIGDLLQCLVGGLVANANANVIDQPCQLACRGSILRGNAGFLQRAAIMAKSVSDIASLLA
jgi:hypothetical protein